MRPGAAFAKWSLIGAAASVLLLVGQSLELGGAAGLLQVGEGGQLRSLIEPELGELPLVPGYGHDGQIYYAIGLDLRGDTAGPLLDHAAYRYRRILYPLIASGFGLLEGRALLVGMIVTTVVSAAVAAGATAATARRLGQSDWLALAVVLNPGVWLSVRLLTADITAMALMICGLYALLVGSRWLLPLFAFSGLAKDVYLLTPAGVAIGRDKRRWLVALVPAAVLALWMLWLTVDMGEGFTGRGNLGWPLIGMIDAAANWAHLGGDERFYFSFSMASVAAGLGVAVFRSTWLRWPILSWSLLAVVSSSWVWDFGNNAARAFAPILVLVALSGARDTDQRFIESAKPSRTLRG